jgi:hypothetical protein
LAEQKRFAFSYNKKEERRNEINKRRETRRRREFESLYLVCYDGEDKYDDWGSPKLLKCFSGIEGRVLCCCCCWLFLHFTPKMTVLKVARNITVYRHIHTPPSHSDVDGVPQFF